MSRIAASPRATLTVFVLVTALLLPTRLGTSARQDGGRTRDVARDGAGKAGVEVGRPIKLYDKSHALVIGVSRYTHGWSNLPGVEADLPPILDAMRRHGFNAKVVTDAARTTSKGIRSAVEEFIESYGKDGDNRLLIYFAGHGHTGRSADGRQLGYVVPSDAPLPGADDRRFRQTAISMEKFESYARDIESKHALFVFDSCFSGTIFSSMRGPGEISPDIQHLARQPVRFFITAGAENQRVPDRSLFRKVFVDALNGKADTDGDGFVTGTELGVYVSREVTTLSNVAQTPLYGKIKDWELSRGDFIFALPKSSPGDSTTQTANAALALLTTINRMKVILPCQPGTISATCTPTDPKVLTWVIKGDSLLYTFSTTGGRFVTEGESTTLDLTGVKPGKHTVTVELDDGLGNITFTSTTFTVEACSDCAPSGDGF